MLQADTRASVECIASALSATSHPTHDAHYLFCLAQLSGPRESVRDKIAAGFLEIDRKLRKRKLLTDRNWSINLRDALKVQLGMDPGIAATMARARQVSPASAHLLELLPAQNRRDMARTMSLAARTGTMTPSALRRNIFPLRDSPLLDRLRDVWMSEPQLRATAGFMSRHGNSMDRKRAEEFSSPTAKIDLTPTPKR